MIYPKKPTVNKKQQLELDTEHGKTDWFKIGKAEHWGCILSPCLFNLYAGWMWNHHVKCRLDEAQAGIKTVGEILITSDMQMTPPLWHMWRGTKEPLDEVREESEKAG